MKFRTLKQECCICRKEYLFLPVMNRFCCGDCERLRLLAISFSGGKTSALLVEMCLELLADYYDEIRITFANTGREDQKTLEYVDKCDRLLFGNRVVWMEADISPVHNEGVRHKVVTFATASRNGEPFEAYIAKYGIPNQSFPQCNSRLKTQVMEDYFRSIGWRPQNRVPLYDTAIGIRADEIDRMSSVSAQNRLIYPLIKWDIKKEDVLKADQERPFQLEIPELNGNCETCWKKSIRKLATIAKHNPERFDFERRMEQKYAHVKAPELHDGKRRYFRGHRTVDDIFQIAADPAFIEWGKDAPEDSELDTAGGCGESCDIYTDYDVLEPEPGMLF